MNAKTKKAVVTDAVTSFTSLSDAAYKQAGAFEVTDGVAHYVMSKAPSFPDEVPTEVKDELYKGYKQRFAQTKGVTMYAVIGDHIVLATQEHRDNAKIEKIEIGVDYAFSYTSQEFGKLRNDRPALHAIIAEIRDKTQTYCSNRMGDLKRAVRKIKNAGSERTRTANKNFAEYIDKFFVDSFDRLKSAKARGDTTADLDRFNKAKVAFMTAWKHG